MNALNAVPARFDQTSQQRRSMIAKIHVAKKTLQMDEDDYRQALFERTGRTSLTECTDPQLARVLDFMKSKGFKPLGAKGHASHPMARKARAIWISLHKLGAVHNSSEQALEAFARRQLKCERFAWADQRQAYKLIEALKAMAVRAGWQQHCRATGRAFGTPLELQTSLCNAILVKLKDAGVIPANWALHDAAWKLCGIENGKASAWTAEDYDLLASALGEKLRKHASPSTGEAA